MEVKTHVMIDKKNKRKLKILASIRGTSFKELLNLALKQYIDREDNGGCDDDK